MIHRVLCQNNERYGSTQANESRRVADTLKAILTNSTDFSPLKGCSKMRVKH